MSTANAIRPKPVVSPYADGQDAIPFRLMRPVRLGDTEVTELKIKIKPIIFADAALDMSGKFDCNFYQYAQRGLKASGQPAEMIELMSWPDVRQLGATMYNIFVGAEGATSSETGVVQ